MSEPYYYNPTIDLCGSWLKKKDKTRRSCTCASCHVETEHVLMHPQESIIDGQELWQPLPHCRYCGRVFGYRWGELHVKHPDCPKAPEIAKQMKIK
jgi:hypothetical protein